MHSNRAFMHRFLQDSLHRCMALLLCWAGCIGVAWAQGSVVSIGGALRDDNVAVWSRVVQLAGGPGARFVVFGTASDNPEASAAANIALLQRHGALAQAVPVAPRMAGITGIDLAAAVHDPQWIAMVRGAKGVYFGGGDQRRIVDTLAPGGVPSPLLLAIRQLLREGGVVAGSSAGAAVMSELMFTGGEPLAVMKNTAGKVHSAGLGFVQSGVLIDQHFLKRGRIARLLPLMQRQGLQLGIGVEEDSAIVVQGETLEVIGRKGALVVELHGASSDASINEFNVRGARLSYLEANDRLHLATRVMTPSPAKANGRRVAPGAPGFRPYFQGDSFFADMLADFAIVGAMTRLVDSSASEVRGLAMDVFSHHAKDKPELAFEWRLYRGADTSAWSLADDYSIVGVLLDVQPVRLARPLYTPWR
jgi:cyanophycinase